MPMLMRPLGTLETLSLRRRSHTPLANTPCVPQYPIYARGAHCHNISVYHHKSQPSVAFIRMRKKKFHNSMLLPVLKPEVSRNPSVMLIDLPVAPLPVVVLAGRNVQPADEFQSANPAPITPVSNKIHHLVPRIVGHPRSTQTSPSVFFRATCSSISSDNTSFFCVSFFSNPKE